MAGIRFIASERRFSAGFEFSQGRESCRPAEAWRLHRVGGQSDRSTNTTFALIARDVLGLNLRIVQGFPGTNDITLAMERHEVDGQVMQLSYIKSSLRDRWGKGELHPIIQFGRVSRLPELPDVPTGRELAKTDEDRELIAFAEAPFFMAAPFAAPPGIPADRAEALKRAFMQTTSDPHFVEEARGAGIEVSPIDGDAIEKLISSTAATPAGILARFKRVTGVT
jgi:tripartite-type tricarboxylate transporter receptor subunit TctC